MDGKTRKSEMSPQNYPADELSEGSVCFPSLDVYLLFLYFLQELIIFLFHNY